MLKFICTNCGAHIQADDSFGGKQVLCPTCNEAMTAPTATNSAIATAVPAKIGKPTATSSGAFAEGLPPLHDAHSLPREQAPDFIGRWLPHIIVAGIVIVAVALIIPAVQKTREAAFRTQSINNLKQIGLATHGFHDSNRRLPCNGTKPAAPSDQESGSWAWMIIPYIESSPMFAEKRTDFGMAVFMCPGRSRPDRCIGLGGPGAWTDYFINPFLNDPNGIANAPDLKLNLKKITDGTSNTILVGHGQIRPDDYASTDAIPGFTATIFDGGNPALCRGKRQIVNAPDSDESMPGQWGGPFSHGSLMAMCDGTVHIFAYSKTGGLITNGVCDRPEDASVFGHYLTPTGQEAVIFPN